MKSKKLLFFIVIILAILLRFWQLGSVPVSPDWDEASLGYNAYSILKTGRDEYGTFLPAVLRSFDDYKPPLYMYLTVPSVALFGLSVWSVRLPAAIMGILAVIGTYFLVIEILKLLDNKQKQIYRYLPLVSMALLAISPWHVHFSRIAFEANVGVTFNIWFLVFFFRGLSKQRLWNWSAIFAVLALYAYHSERVFIPMMICILAVMFRKQVFTEKGKLILPILIGTILLLPLFKVFADPVNWTRLKGTSALSDTTRLLERSAKRLDEDAASGNFFGKIFDNRRIVYVQKLAEGYLSHFSLRWLFITGDNDRHHAPDMGLLYIIELPILFYGLYKTGKLGGKFTSLVIAWLLISPVAASPTNETPHAIRTLVVLPSLQIILATGIIGILEWTKKYGVIILFVLYGLNFWYYMHMYYGHMNNEFSYNWQYGYKEAVDEATKQYDSVDKIIVSTSLEQPHMFFLFYLNYPPEKYLADGGTMSGGFAEYRNHFDKYYFRKIDMASEKPDGKTLYIGPPGEVSSGYFKTIYYLDGIPAINIAR